MRYILTLALLTLPALPAQAQTADAFGRTVAVASDGITYSVTNTGGATISATFPSIAAAVAAFDALPPPGYAPVSPAQTKISVYLFLLRLTSAERAAIRAYNPDFADLLNATAASNRGMIDVTNPILIADMQAAVTGGALTAARMTQVLNLAVASP